MSLLRRLEKIEAGLAIAGPAEFNAKTEGYLKILKAIADFNMFWVEIDSYNPKPTLPIQPIEDP